MRISSDNDEYDAANNGEKCYSLAIRSIRLQKIRAGQLAPRVDDPEELEAAKEGGFQIVQAECHRRSA